jgi:glycosyltransferase involved in cell wall biosynthesis
MRILALNHEFPPLGGGGGVATHQICKHLCDFGHEVDVVTQHFGDIPHEETVDGMRVHRVNVNRKKKNTSGKFEMFVFIIRALLLSRRLIRRKRYDAVFAVFAVPSGAVAMALKRLYGIPYVISMQGSDVPGYDPETHPGFVYRMLKPCIRRIWRGAKHLAANSEYMRNLALGFYKGAEILTIHNGVDLENYERLAAEPRRGRRFRIISVTRLVERKGLQHLLRSLPAVLKGAKGKIEVLIIGDGPYRGALEKMKREMGLDCVRFLGRIDHKELPKHYKNADLFVLPSEIEAFGVVFTEAMAGKLPVVATRIGGIPEVVIDGKTGILVPPGNKDELAKAIIKLANDEKLARGMGIAGERRVSDHFTWRAVAERYGKALINR